MITIDVAKTEGEVHTMQVGGGILGTARQDTTTSGITWHHMVSARSVKARITRHMDAWYISCASSCLVAVTVLCVPAVLYTVVWHTGTHGS